MHLGSGDHVPVAAQPCSGPRVVIDHDQPMDISGVPLFFLECHMDSHGYSIGFVSWKF